MPANGAHPLPPSGRLPALVAAGSLVGPRPGAAGVWERRVHQVWARVVLVLIVAAIVGVMWFAIDWGLVFAGGVSVVLLVARSRRAPALVTGLTATVFATTLGVVAWHTRGLELTR